VHFFGLYCITRIILAYFKCISRRLFNIHLIPIFFAAATFVALFDPEDEDIYYFEMSVTVYLSTRRNVAQDFRLYEQRCENFNSRLSTDFLIHVGQEF
jgi:hypothetical protein